MNIKSTVYRLNTGKKWTFETKFPNFSAFVKRVFHKLHQKNLINRTFNDDFKNER